MAKVVFCNIAWMKFYSSITNNDQPKNGGAFVKENNDACESFNFYPYNHYCLGYVRAPGQRLNLARVEDVPDYVNKIDEKTQTQFSAITIKINENELYISFRGTDNTLIGWKEDFNMGFVFPVPAQELAVDYIEKIASRHSENMLIGGHSKGGNLAVYSAAFCSEAVPNRIEIVYNFDGPGFDEKVLQKDGYKRICDKVNTFVPQSSVVGMLLAHEERYIIVHSTQLGLLQHDLYSWSVQIDSFICLEAVDNTSRFIDYTLKAWIANLDYEQREKFVDTMYTILTKTNANTVKELEGNIFMNAITMLKSIKDLDEPTRKALTQVFMSLLKSTRVGLLQVVINKDLIVK